MHLSNVYSIFTYQLNVKYIVIIEIEESTISMMDVNSEQQEPVENGKKATTNIQFLK